MGINLGGKMYGNKGEDRDGGMEEEWADKTPQIL
jgi:hypothetical protein